MFYTNFLKLCNRKGIAPTAAAVEMGFHRSDATRWSKGAEPRRTTLEKVADYFGVTVSDLIGDDSAQKEKPTAQGDGLKLDSYEDIDQWLGTLDGKGLDMVIALAIAKKVKINEDKP